MEDIYLLIGAAVLLVIQIACFFTKKIWIRILPLLLLVALMVLCLVMYWVSGWTNWGYLILLMLLFGVLVVFGIVWLIFGVICGIKKMRK